VASLASPSQSQGRSSEKMTQETSGQIQPDLYGGLGHQLSFSKMFPESLSITSVQSDPNYERWVTRLRKDYSQRQRQAHPTNASESSFWPTARASDNEGGIPSNVELSDGSFSRTNADGVRWGVKLKDATANWTTPLADDTNTRKNKFAQGGTPLSITASEKSGTNPNTGKGEGLNKTAKHWLTPKAGNPGSRKPGTGGKVLNEEAKKWPTPNASEHKYRMQGNTQQSNGLTATARKSDIHSTLQAPETGTDGHTCSPSCRRLNPLFAEHLMGLPLGWTCVSGPLETESFQRWQLALSAYLARN